MDTVSHTVQVPLCFGISGALSDNTEYSARFSDGFTVSMGIQPGIVGAKQYTILPGNIRTDTQVFYSLPKDLPDCNSIGVSAAMRTADYVLTTKIQLPPVKRIAKRKTIGQRVYNIMRIYDVGYPIRHQLYTIALGGIRAFSWKHESHQRYISTHTPKSQWKTLRWFTKYLSFYYLGRPRSTNSYINVSSNQNLFRQSAEMAREVYSYMEEEKITWVANTLKREILMMYEFQNDLVSPEVIAINDAVDPYKVYGAFQSGIGDGGFIGIIHHPDYTDHVRTLMRQSIPSSLPFYFSPMLDGVIEQYVQENQQRKILEQTDRTGS